MENHVLIFLFDLRLIALDLWNMSAGDDLSN